MRMWLSVLIAAAVIATSTRALAQQASGAGATLVHAEGGIYLNDLAFESNSGRSALPDNVLLRTSEGRAAIALKRGGVLFLDAGTSVRVLANGAYHFNRIEVLAGSAIIASETSTPLVDCENTIRLSEAGLFRFDVQPVNSAGERSCRFRVFEGAAAVALLSVTNALRAGRAMMCNRRCGDMIPTTDFSREQLDDFDQWARRMPERLRR